MTAQPDRFTPPFKLRFTQNCHRGKSIFSQFNLHCLEWLIRNISSKVKSSWCFHRYKCSPGFQIIIRKDVFCCCIISTYVFPKEDQTSNAFNKYLHGFLKYLFCSYGEFFYKKSTVCTLRSINLGLSKSKVQMKNFLVLMFICKRVVTNAGQKYQMNFALW